MTSPIGQPVSRVDGRLKVTGAATYTADTPVPNLAYGYLVTSTVGKGTVVSMDTTAAAAAPGVLAVYTPFNPLKLFSYTQNQNDETTPPLQDTSVRYYGQTIGFVVAETFEQARDAASLVTAVYDAQPPVTGFPGPAAAAAGPPAKALADAPVTISGTYSTPIEHHVAMEPHATLAVWTGDHLTVYSSTQGVMLVRARLATTLGVDAAKIHVLGPYVGGGFGSKWGNWAHTPLTAAAAQALNRPVKTVLTREQTFTVVGHRPMSSNNLVLGAASDGTLQAIQHEGTSSRSNASGFTDNLVAATQVTYAAASIQATRKSVSLDVPATTIMRAPGEASGSFALESALDELAVALNMDPIDLRRRNDAAVVPGTTTPWSSKHLDECYTVGAQKFGWAARNPKPGAVVDGDWLVGLGMATCSYQASRAQASIKVRLLADGSAEVGGTGADLGTGQFTVFAILGADGLGIPVSRVHADLGDSVLPTAANAGGSGSTSTNGPAVQLAVAAAKTALIDLAVQNEKSPFHGLDPAAVTYANGTLSANGTTVAFGDLLTTVDVPAVEATATSPKNARTDVKFRSFGAHFCAVRVNRFTAEPRVSRWLSVIDAGTIVNEKTAANQIMGAVVMGIGSALLEEGRLEAGTGRIANGNLQSYLVPVNADIPHLDVEFLHYPDSALSDLGARGIGELGIVGAAAAVANAVYNATGRRVRDLPITLDKLL